MWAFQAQGTGRQRPCSKRECGRSEDVHEGPCGWDTEGKGCWQPTRFEGQAVGLEAEPWGGSEMMVSLDGGGLVRKGGIGLCGWGQGASEELGVNLGWRYGAQYTEVVKEVSRERTESPGLGCGCWEVCTGVARELGEEPGLLRKPQKPGLQRGDRGQW